jgi:aminopeptidase N
MRYLTCLFLFFSLKLAAQYFQSPNNPYYWKNKKPYQNYWQQDIEYHINASLDERLEIISGVEKIVYTNNSPDTLFELFFNLYQNAFLKNSYLTDLQNANDVHPKFGYWESQNKGNEIRSLKVDGLHCRQEIDGSIMRVALNKPIAPNTKVEIEIDFKTYYSMGGDTRRRMKRYIHQNRKHFNGAHWYPRLAVYDRKFKWCTDQHLNREFYGDFGDYYVNLTFPADYIVEATGLLQNQKEVLPDTLRKKLDLSNYWNLPWDTAVTFHQKIDSGATKTWRYVAHNVHDFAWIAGPHYRIHDSTANGFQVVALVLEPHASGWKTAIDFTRNVMDVYQKDIGKYAYPKMVVADCQDGMEYPMLTMDGGSEPGYRKLLAHEVGHNWFYGMVNNNETYRAMLDEGFTQFLTVWALESIDGKYIKQNVSKNKLANKVHEHTCSREANIYNGYMYDAMRLRDPSLNTHSDGFNGALGQGGGYGHVYTKTATMLYNLQYVLGDALFLNAMQHYFNQWSFCHPYIEDFRQSIIDYTKVDLNWFFDQWIETSKHIDYKLSKPKLLDSNFNYELKLKRKGEMQMPLDLTFQGKSGNRYHFYIPNTWWQKETKAKPLQRWIGWDNNLKTTYKTSIHIGEPIIYGTIDTSRRLADINALNNSTKLPVKTRLDHLMGYTIDRHTYNVNLRPDLWYNNTDGIKFGIHADGNYMRFFHNFEADVWFNSRIGQSWIREQSFGGGIYDPIAFRFSYSHPLDKWIKNSTIFIQTKWMDGIVGAKLALNKIFSDKLQTYISFKTFGLTNDYSLNYQYLPDLARSNGMNTSLSLGFNFNNVFSNIYQKSRLEIRTSLLNQNSYSYISSENTFKKWLGRTLLSSRFFGRIGVHASENSPAFNSLLNAGGANTEELLEDEFMRAVGIFPNELFNASSNNAYHLQMAGGTNLRGYAFRRNIVDGTNNYQLLGYNSGYSANFEFFFHHLSPIKFRKIAPIIGFETYLFSDIGQLANTLQNFNLIATPILADAGIGAAIHVKRWGQFAKANPLYFRFDMPLYVSQPNQNDQNQHFAFRWLIGVGRSF